MSPRKYKGSIQKRHAFGVGGQTESNNTSTQLSIHRRWQVRGNQKSLKTEHFILFQVIEDTSHR